MPSTRNDAEDMQGVVPSDLPGRVLPHVYGGSLTFLVGALPVNGCHSGLVK
jgi:hypothetical protein